MIALSKSYGILPSEVMGISDHYTAFCFNEACLYIMNGLSSGKGQGLVFFEDKEDSGLIGFLKKTSSDAEQRQKRSN